MVILALVIVIAWLWQRRQSRELTGKELALRAADAELARTRKELSAARAKAVTEETGRKAAERKLAAANAGVGGEAGAQKAKKKGTARLSDFVQQHPEFAGLREYRVRKDMIRQYGDLLAQLKLPPDQLAKVKTLLTEQDLAEGDARIAAADKHLDPNGQEARRAAEVARNEIKEQLVAILGKDGMSQVQAGMRYKGDTDNAGAAMADQGVPMTADQGAALAMMMQKAAGASPSEVGAYAGFRDPDPETGLTGLDREILAQAAGTFSAAQIDVLKSSLRQRNLEQKMYDQVFKTTDSLRND